MVKFTKLLCILVLSLFGISSANAEAKTIALVPGVWSVDGATFAAYAWNSEGNAWFPFVEVSGTGTYATQVPDTFTGILLARINPEGSDSNPWNNVWNQTDDIDFTTIADQTVFTITGWGDGGHSTFTINAPSSSVDALKATLAKVIKLAKIFGYDTTTAEALLASDEATAEQLTAALQTLAAGAKDKANEAVTLAEAFFERFDATAAAALAEEFAAAKAALAGDDIDAMLAAAEALVSNALVEGQSAMMKVDNYLRKMNDETVNTDLNNIQTALATNDLQAVVDAIRQLKSHISDAATAYVAGVSTIISDGATAGKDVTAMQTAYSNFMTIAIKYKSNQATLVELGYALYNLIKAVEDYKLDNCTYTIAGTKDLTGTENDWDIVEANNMTIDTETGLYTWTAENITVTAENQPAFKVVKTDLDGQTWYPEGDETTNWIINTAVTGEEGVFNITITFNAVTLEIAVDAKKATEPEAEDIAIYPVGGDIAAALEEAKAKVAKVGNITINLAVDGDYTISATLTAPNSIFVYGNEATVIVAEEMTDNFITLNGTEVFAKKADDTESDHYFIQSVEVRGLNLKGLKGALVKDAQKTLVENLVIDWSNIEMPASNKNVLDFNSKGYVGKVTVTGSTIWANAANTGFFAQYGSRPKNVNGDWLQEFDFENNTIVNIANGKNFNNLKQNGTAQNVYTIKNNIFVDCGKQNQVVVGMNNGQTSATPAWDVTGNYFAWGGACVNAAETEKAGQKDGNDIVKDCVEGELAFTDAANGDFNGEFALAEGAATPDALGAPYWTINFTAAPAPAQYYLVGTMTNWVDDGVKEENKLTLNTEAGEGVEEYMITLYLTPEDQFKIVKPEGDSYTWYPVGTGNNYGENGEITEAGDYTVYFRPNGDGGSDWFHGIIYVQNNSIVGISTVTVNTEDAVIYNMKGQRVNKAQKGLYIVNGKKQLVK